MIVIPSYKILAQIYESSSSIVYRGLRERDNLPVILKVLKQDYPTPQELARYKQEYQITRNLKLEGTVKAYDLLPYQKTLVIILEDFGASSLKQLQLDADAKTFSLVEFLKIAIQATDALGQIHANNIIHKDINPANLVFNPKTKQLKIIDFGIATQFDQENPILKNPNVLEGTLAYISPEQTGRMNRSLDYRTDFYSLGVTFYEGLTGQLPFETEDLLELVHCHIAKVPTPPHQINPDIPQILSELVMKLLAKTAEERYQSAWGIKADLKECLGQLEITGKIEPFPLATQDISDKFQIPQKLYGREKEIETLLAAFERVAGEDPPLPPLLRGELEAPLVKGGLGGSRVELMLVAGYSGIGKSALVQELYKPITEKQGYFISGKFDQFQRNIPYSAVVAAFQDLVRQLLTESEKQLDRWREKLLTTLGSNGRVIIDVIPEVELVIGKQPSVPELGPTESQNRFNFVFQNFIRAFCSREHPLVIFLDDLQWIDSATLKLIELMMADATIQYLFLIGAYRNNEVGNVHPLTITLKELRKQKAAIDVITLAPLGLNPLSQLIAETLHQNLESVKPLAELVIGKTRGNPFFVNEFLKTLYAENLLSFKFPQSSLNRDKKVETTTGFWQWDIKQIEAQGITDNVVKLTIGKLKKLPKSTQKALQLAACVGAYFDLKTLVIVSEKSKTEIFSALTPALQAGLILPISELDEDLLIQDYQFLHDRVQQAAYASIDESKKQAVHLHMGRLLLQNTPPQARSEKIFEIVDRFNSSIELVTSSKERSQIAKLNWIAGKKAKAATAYDAAVRYLKQGRELLANESWQHEYALTLNLYVESIESEYLNANYDEVEALFDVAIARARTTLDKIDLYATKILLYSAKNQMQSAIDTGLEALNLLGISMVQSKPQIANIEELYNLPRMTAPDKQAALQILMMLFGPIYTTNPSLLSSLSFTMVALCLNHGNAPRSAYAYGLYGLLLCGVLDDIELGYQFGKLALNVLEKFDAREIKCRVYNKFYSFILHWKDAARNTLEPLQETIKIGLDTGEVEFTCYATVNYCHNLALLGQPLDDVQPEIQSCIGLIQSLKQNFQLYYTQIWGQFVSNLRGESKDKIQSIGEFYDETENLPVLLENDNFSSLYCFYITKTILAYLFEDYDRALLQIQKAEQYESGIVGLFPFSQNPFYSSLVRLARYFSLSELERSQSLNKVIENQKKLEKWAESAPMNYGHKYELVEAEKARVLGQILEAEELYDRAIEGARKNEYLHEEALAYELAAKFYLERGRERIARTYMQEAHYAYARWNARAKVEDLESKYPHLLPQVATRYKIPTQTTISITTTGSQSGEVLDLATAMKAYRAISREIELDKLLETLMQVLIENAGAQTGALVLERSGEWVIEALGSANTDKVAVLQSLSLKNRLPESILNYVIHTQEIVVEADAVNRGRFTNDLEIQTRQIRSVLCAPLLNQGRLSGIVYLENNLATDTFTSERLQTIQMLSGQAAIAIANARLYAEVRENERHLQQFLEAMPVGVAIHNATGEVEYLNQLAKQLTAFDAIPEANSEQIARVYGACRAGTEQLYPTEELPISRSLRGETVKVDDLELRRRDRVVPLEIFSTPIFDKRGKIQYAIAAFQDITQRQQAQKILEDYNSTLEGQVAERTEALQQKNEDLKIALEQLQTTQKQLVESEKMSALGGLVAGIAHEVNTPLGIGVAVASHLFDKTADLTQAYRTGKMKKSQLEQFLNTSERSTQLLLEHLNQAAELIQSFKQVSVDQSSEVRRTFKLKEYLQAIAISFQPQLRGTNHQIEIQGEESLILDSYPGALSQIVTNFLTNSLAHGYNSEEFGKIKIYFLREKDTITLNYSDNGKGISPEHREKIFNPFFTTARGRGGSGLGLHIVYNLVTQKLGGMIECKSQLGAGTTFVLQFPSGLQPS